MDGIITRHLLIRGRVQGVYYRASMVEQARRLNLRGWVRNRLDGSVEALAQGADAAVQDLIGWARQGPKNARVDAVQVSQAPAQPLAAFEQRATA
ncbi:MAG: acylphosphatase [Desulfovibrionaceae bacterium]|jgi:acylphosphatase|nr:acylphosphatase [Desulfovibrionaceae bacterium]